MKFQVLRANTKYNKSWHDEWVIIGGDWGHSMHIDKIEYPVSTQFIKKNKYDNRKISTKSKGVLKRIQDRAHINMKYPSADSYNAAKVDQYSKISLAYPSM